MEINTQITIQAPPEKVWSILTNYSAYPSWNPLIKSLTGDVKVGNTIVVKIDAMTFKPKVLVYDANKEFSWLGHLLFPGLFDGHHTFKLVDNGNGTTTFIHQEKFKGLLLGLLKKKLENESKPNFILMNEKLKEQAEKNHMQV